MNSKGPGFLFFLVWLAEKKEVAMTRSIQMMALTVAFSELALALGIFWAVSTHVI
jgi:hypothetical protein